MRGFYWRAFEFFPTTAMGSSGFLAILLCWTAFVAFSSACPDAEALLPCTCDLEGINCAKARSTQELATAFRAPGGKEHKELWIQKTPIESFPAGILGAFKFGQFHVELNPNLTTFDLNSLKNTKKFVEVISLYGNALSSFDFKGTSLFPSLQVLNLGKNKLRTIPGQALRHPILETLVLSENPIVSLEPQTFARLPSLKSLFLSGTRLTTLGDYSMTIVKGHAELSVDLADNPISSISSEAFEGTTPQVLDLSRNNLTTLSQAVFDPLLGRMLRKSRQQGAQSMVLLKGNPISCFGCFYRWLVPLRTSPNLNLMLPDFSCWDGTKLNALTYNKIRCDRYGPF